MKRLLTGGVGANAVWLATITSSGGGKYLAEFLFPRALGGAVGVGGTAGPEVGEGATGFTVTGVLFANPEVGVEGAGLGTLAATFGVGMGAAAAFVDATVLPEDLAAAVGPGAWAGWVAGFGGGAAAGWAGRLTLGWVTGLGVGLPTSFLAGLEAALAAGLAAVFRAAVFDAAAFWTGAFWTTAFGAAVFWAVLAAVVLAAALAAGPAAGLAAVLVVGFFRGWVALWAFAAILFTGFSSPGGLRGALVAAWRAGRPGRV